MTDFWFASMAAVSVGESECQKQTDFAPQIRSQLKQCEAPHVVSGKRQSGLECLSKELFHSLYRFRFLKHPINH